MTVLRKFVSLDRRDRRLVFEAAGLMTLVWAGLRVLGYPRVRQLLDRHAAPPTALASLSARQDVEPICRAIAAVGARFGPATCLVQALAGDAMLRRRGVTSILRIGVRVAEGDPTPFEAHAWVECEGAVVIGVVEHLADFGVLGARR